METTRRGFFGRILGCITAAALPAPPDDNLFNIWRQCSAPVTIPTLEYNGMLATTLNRYHSALMDRIFEPNPIYDYLMRNIPRREEQLSFDWHTLVITEDYDEEDFYD